MIKHFGFIFFMLTTFMYNVYGDHQSNINDVLLKETINISTFSLDLDSYLINDDIKLLKKDNDLILQVNKEYILFENIYDHDMSLKPMISIINKKWILLTYAYKINGGTDGFYKAKIFKYSPIK
ncbi:MAG: hypothetical protein N4A63_12225 [Vallitalea sp.]|nr:hypothetical protein [Vallitalea sp.]